MKRSQPANSFPEAMELEYLSASAIGGYYTAKLYALVGFAGLFRRVKRSATGTKMARAEAVLARWGGALIELVRSSEIDLELRYAGIELPAPPKDSGVPVPRPIGERSLFDGPVKTEPEATVDSALGEPDVEPTINRQSAEVEAARWRIRQAIDVNESPDPEDEKLVSDYYASVERGMVASGAIPERPGQRQDAPSVEHEANGQPEEEVAPAVPEDGSALRCGGEAVPLTAAELLKRSRQQEGVEETVEKKPSRRKKEREVP